MPDRTLEEDMQTFQHKKELGAQEAIIEHEASTVAIKQSQAIRGDSADRDSVLMMVGQWKALSAVRKVVTVTMIMNWKYIKENKVFRHVGDIEVGGKVVTITTWQDFCTHLIGLSREHVDEKIRQVETLGAEAIEALDNVGMSARAKRQFRLAPAEVQGAVKEAAEKGDKDTLLEILDGLAAKHAKEKEALEKQTKDLEGDLEATRRVVEGKNERITELETEAHKRDTLTPDEREVDLRKRLQKAIELVSADYLMPLSVIKEIFDWDEAPDSLRHACAEGVTRLFIELEQLRLDYHLPITAPDLVPPRPELVE